MQAQWIVAACDHIRSSPAIAVNGFKAAGIVKAIEQPETLSDDDETEGDPFASGSDEGDPFASESSSED